MHTITLPDGNNLSFSKKITGLEVAEKISKSLAKQANNKSSYNGRSILKIDWKRRKKKRFKKI